MEITKEQIGKLKGTYKANKEELDKLDDYIEEYGFALDDGISDATDSFEQGYNNALEFVFEVLGIEY